MPLPGKDDWVESEYVIVTGNSALSVGWDGGDFRLILELDA